jgi:hypothetical protein
MGDSGTGLKSQFGVGDPQNPAQNTPNAKDAGSDKQAQDFQAAFQQEQGVINGHLQYTAVNAEATRHDPLAARRDALYTAFQAALAKIDRKDTAKAQGDIDKVLADARALAGEVAAFRQQAEKAKSDWDSRQGKYDEAVHHVEELEAWEDAKAPALRGLVDGIRNQVNLRQYAQACNTIDQLLPKLDPIYEEYLRQREAKPQYEQQLAEQSARLDPLKAAERPSQPMTAKAAEAEPALQEAKGKAETKDFVAGLDCLGKFKGLVDELDTLTHDPQRQQYLADSQAEGQTCEAQPEPAFKTLDADWSAIEQASAQAQPLADNGDYAAANQALADGKAKRAEFQQRHDELVQQKQAYEDTLTQVQPRLQAASLSEPQYAKLQPMQQDMVSVQTQMESAAQAEDFAQALTLVQDLSTKLDALEQAKLEIDQKKQEYEAALAAVQPRLQAASTSEPQYAKLAPMQQEIAPVQSEMEAAAQAGDYDKANQSVQDLGAKLDAFEAAKAEIDQKKQEYEAALAAVQPRLQAASTSEPQYAKLAPMQQDLALVRHAMEAAAQAGDYDKANQCLQDLGAKLDAFDAAKAEIDQKKQEYEAALAAVQPRLQAASTSEPQYTKLAPMQQDLASAQSEVEAAAQAGDYDKAKQSLQDLSVKLDAFEKAKAEIDQKKQEYEAALAPLQPRLQAASVSEAQYTKLGPMQQELASAQSEMEAAAQAGDYDKANQCLPGIGAKLDAFEKAKAEIDQQKLAYETLRALIEPRITQASKKQYLNLAPKLEEIKKLQGLAGAAAQTGDYAVATQHLNDASVKTDAYVAAADKEVEPPIMGDTQNARADAVMKKLPEADQKEVKALLDSAKSEAEKQYLLKGVAAGHPVAELKAFAKKIEGKDETWMRDHLSVTGSSTGSGVKQQWHDSCNATAAQAVKAQMDPLYALKLHEENPDLDKADNTDGTKMNPKLAAEQKSGLESDYKGGVAGGTKGLAKPRVSSDGSGRWADDLLNNQSDTTGISYKTQLDPPVGDAIKLIDSGVGKGQPVPIVIGKMAGNYQHYVVVTGMTKGPPKQYTIHNPWDGSTVVRTEAQISSGAMNLAGGNQITAIENPSAKEVK